MSLSALDGLGSDVAGQNAVLGVVLEVTAGESGTMDVHSGSVPAGDVHLISHCADGIAEAIGQLLVPGSSDHDGSGEADGASLSEVVVDGSGAVAVVGADLADGVHSDGLIAAQRDQGVHLIQSQLIHEGLPLCIVIGDAAHFDQLDALLSAGGDGLGIGIFVSSSSLSSQVVGVVVESSLVLFAHLIVGGSGSSDSIVGKAVCTGQISDALQIFSSAELVDSGGLVGGTGVGFVIDDVRVHSVDLRSDHIVGVGVDGDDIVTGLQDIAAIAIGVIGSHFLSSEGNSDRLGSAGLQQTGLGKLNQVSGSLFNAAVGVRRIVVDLDNVLTSHIAGIGDVDFHGDLAVSLGHGDQLLSE